MDKRANLKSLIAINRSLNVKSLLNVAVVFS